MLGSVKAANAAKAVTGWDGGEEGTGRSSSAILIRIDQDLLQGNAISGGRDCDLRPGWHRAA